MKELNKIKAMDTAYITPAVAATVCKMDPNSLRWLAHNNPSELPFPVEIAGKQGTRVRIPRLPFIAAYEQQEKPGIEDKLDELTRAVSLIASALGVSI